MHTRHITIRGAQNIDAGVTWIRDFLPIFSEQHGFRGVSVSADREAGLLGVTSQWASELDLDASESVVGKGRDEGVKRTGGVLTIEKFELTTDAIARRPVPGNPVLVARVSMDPASVDENISRFEREILPAIASLKGFSCLRMMANRREGRCVLGIVWQYKGALEKFTKSMEAERDVALMQGLRIDEISPREMLLIEVD